MVRIPLSTLASLGILSFAIAACGGPPEGAASPSSAPPSASPSAAAGVAKEPGDAKVGDKTKCAVSGEEMTVEATSPKAEYQGTTYYFCCGGCKKKFEADPAKYVKKS